MTLMMVQWKAVSKHTTWGRPLEEQTHRCQVVRLMQRVQGHQLLERGENRGLDVHRLCVLDSAVHHAMADADQMAACESPPQERHEVVQRAAVVERGPIFPGGIRLDLSATIPGDESWSGVEPFDLPPNVQLELAVAPDEQRELDA